MDCVDSPRASDRTVEHLAAGNPLKGSRLTLFTVDSFAAGVAHADARHAVPVAPAQRIDALGHGNVTLGALPAAVALTAPPGVLAVTAAQNWTGG